MRFVVFALLAGCNGILGQHPGVVDDAGCVKQCNGACARADDPAFGCTTTSCTPCALDHASAKCKDGACAIAACDPTFDDLDLDPSTGCETPNPLAVAPDSLAMWLRADKGVVTSPDGGVTGWENQADGGGTQSVTKGAPFVDDASWPNAPEATSISFDGATTFGVDLSAMMSPAGFTAFLAYARFGTGNLVNSCVMGSPTYPTGNPTATCANTTGDGTPGSAFQLGWLDNKTANYEVYCNTMKIPAPPNGATTYQANLTEMWFDPKGPLNVFALNGQQTNDGTQRPHIPINLSAPSILGACPSGATFTGLVGELVVYRTLLANDERTAIETYLKTKWKTP